MAHSVAGPSRATPSVAISPEGVGRHPVRNFTTSIPISLTRTSSALVCMEVDTAAPMNDEIREARSPAIWDMTSGNPLEAYVRLLVSSGQGLTGNLQARSTPYSLSGYFSTPGGWVMREPIPCDERTCLNGSALDTHSRPWDGDTNSVFSFHGSPQSIHIWRTTRCDHGTTVTIPMRRQDLIIGNNGWTAS